MPEPLDTSDRLDSWKAIAAYLKRDERTARRWERQFALPVRRVAGERGMSVFAYSAEIDEWLATAQPAPEEDIAPRPAPGAAGPVRRWRAGWPVAGAAASLTIVVALLALWIVDGRIGGLPARVVVNSAGLVAFDARQVERWRYTFPPDVRVQVADAERLSAAEVLDGARSSILVATSYAIQTADDRVRGGQLLALTPSGRLERSFSPDDRLTFGTAPYEGPWAITDFRVDESSGTRQIALAVHHYTWWPSMVIILDADLQRRATFVNSGWIERVHWLASDRLLASGYSEAFEGGVIALLDATRMNGQSPFHPDGAFRCTTCAEGQALRYVVMRRSEVNIASSSRFNRARLQLEGNRILVRTIEVPQAEGDAADAVYEFTPALELAVASFSSRYWEMHRELEIAGKLDHSREQCPDRDGPRAVQVWSPAAGWQPQRPQGLLMSLTHQGRD